MTVLYAENVSRSFGKVQALHDVSFRVEAGETVALIGHNGAGKTTFFRLILGFLSPQSGELSIDGHSPGSSEAHSAVAYLPETVAFPKTLTGEEVVRFFARLRGTSKVDALEALNRVGLSHAKKRRCGEYSKGMRQRLGLAQALVAAPKLLLLDEPTTGLDPSSRHAFYTLLDEIAASGTAILLSSHGLNELESHTQRVVMLSQGALVAQGTVEDLLARARLPLKVLARGGALSSASLADSVGGHVRADGRVEVSCITKDKMLVLKQLLDRDKELCDVEFHAPGLSELYRHYAGGAGSENS